MYKNLSEYVALLEREGELLRVRTQVDSELEIAEITDRVCKSADGGPALLFENTGTDFPVLTNMLGSERRLELALGGLADAEQRLSELLAMATKPAKKIGMLPVLGRVASWMPRKVRGRGECQREVVRSLDELPVLKCWPHDAGRFITLPLVHTVDPQTGARNVGMYRMQVVDGSTTGMHWHIHKTGERHYKQWKRMSECDDAHLIDQKTNPLRSSSDREINPGKHRNDKDSEARSTVGRMPVTVCLGGDPVYTYAATAPLPDGIDEYLLAGFLRRRAVRLVRCLTNELWVPEDCDFVIEGYVDTAESKFMEGPFGDHTGFYSLEDMYPYFHVTAITRRRDAVYPATIVGIPPQEDLYIARATERLFLEPLRLMQPEVRDLWMPAEGVAHNLALVAVDVSYPGQAFKVAAAMWGAGQMMFDKVLVVLPAGVDLHDLSAVARRVRNADVASDVLFGRGVSDVLDHAATVTGVGGKIALDLTVERKDKKPKCGSGRLIEEWGVVVVYDGVVPDAAEDVNYIVMADEAARGLTDAELLWHVAANTDPVRDIELCDGRLVIDGRTKIRRGDGYPARVPNVVVSALQTIALVDSHWTEYGLGDFIPSPSLHYGGLVYSDGAEVGK